MIKRLLLGFLLGFALLLNSAVFAAVQPLKIVKYSPAIEPYVEALRHAQSPNDYIMSLFAKYDIVILAERDHREFTQWNNYIYNLVSDPRFIAQVGHIFTEYGSVYLQPKLDDFLNKDHLDRQAIIDILHDFLPSPSGWDRNNIYEFLQKFYILNQSLPADSKVQLYFSDEPASWSGLDTQYKYNIFYGMPGSGDFINPRDRIMAMRVFTKFKDIENSSDPRKKALVIMNSRHGFGYIKQLEDPKYAYFGQNMGGYLIKWLPGRVANVMVHTVNEGSGPIKAHLLQDGKWDAAFAVMGDKPMGFDFKDTAFGKDSFDYGQIPETWGTYQDLFTGMVFFNPLREHMVYENIPGFFDENYKQLVRQREFMVCGASCVKDIEAKWQDMKEHPENYNKHRSYTDAFLAPMYHWLTLKHT